MAKIEIIEKNKNTNLPDMLKSLSDEDEEIYREELKDGINDIDRLDSLNDRSNLRQL